MTAGSQGRGSHPARMHPAPSGAGGCPVRGTAAGPTRCKPAPPGPGKPRGLPGRLRTVPPAPPSPDPARWRSRTGSGSGRPSEKDPRSPRHRRPGARETGGAPGSGPSPLPPSLRGFPAEAAAPPRASQLPGGEGWRSPRPGGRGERSGAGTRLPGRLREGEARSPTGAGPREPALSSHRGRPAEALREPEPRRGTGRPSAQARGAPGEHGEPGPAGARQPARSVPPHRAAREEPRPWGERRPRSPTPAASPPAPPPLEPEPSRRGHRCTEPGLRGPASRRGWRRPCPQLAPGLRAAVTLGGAGGRPELRG